MYKLAIIGERESVLGYMALGFLVREAADVEEARNQLRLLAGDPSVAVIFLVENYAEALEEDVARYKDQPIPAIISIPGSRGSTGYGMESIRSAVERAVGADILKD